MAGSHYPSPKRLLRVRMLLILMVSGALCGCASVRGMFNRDPFGPGARRTMPASPNQSQLVQHLNQNIERMSSWRSTDMDIRIEGVPVKLSANCAVERPLNLRLQASSLRGAEVDIGSNSERFWYWASQLEPKHVMTVRHDQMEHARNRLRIPFQPDWIMEAFGVIPFMEEGLKVDVHPESERAYLTSERLSPQSELIRKVTVVDTRHGLVLEHALYDADNRLVARAALSKHEIDRRTGAVYPKRIDLSWPDANMALSLVINNIEIQPLQISGEAWSMPKIEGSPVLDMGRTEDWQGGWHAP